MKAKLHRPDAGKAIALSRSESKGCVYLVGAGPGDPGLITVRGRDLLGRADVVIYDYLSSPQLLQYCPQAEVIYVGKKAAEHSKTQEQINQLLIEHCRVGKRVVRLKGGDPFVFGRGGEECEALAKEGLAFEVVPGITAAIAGPAYAGIPVTHRDLNSSFTLITGHEKEEEYQDDAARQRGGGGASDVDWAALAKLPCLAFYMGVKALPRICRRLIEHGMDRTMPAAVIQWGTTYRQKTVMATVADLAEKVSAAGIGPPAITIIGRVVALRQTINWFEKRPLFGQTIVVTRTRQQASDLSMRLLELGARVIEAPTIELGEPKSWDAVDEALRNAAQYDWIIFTSQNGVSAAKRRLMKIGLDVRAFGAAKIAAIGEATAAAVEREMGLRLDACPAVFVAEALAGELVARQEVKGKRFLLLRADIARPVLRERLKEAGAAEVRDVAIYETKPVAGLPSELLEALDQRTVTWVTFTSSSTARNFVKLLGDGYQKKLDGVKLASIGVITTATIGELGLRSTIQAEQFTVPGLVEAIFKAVEAETKR